MTHRVSLSPQFRASLRERRGGCDHVFDAIEPARTALLVVDMQDAFVAPGGVLEVPAARGIVACINRLAREMRAAGGVVAWIRCSFSQRGRGSWAVWFENFAGARDPERLRSAMYPGGEGHAFWHELEIRDGDLIADKDRFSAFIEGASDLESRLRERGVDTVVVTGTVTNVCCESTVRDAAMRDFRCLMIEDANAARSDEEHVAGLLTVARVFGDVMTADAFIAKLAGAAGRRAGLASRSGA